MADNTLHPLTGTGTADVSQRTIDVGGGVQAVGVIPVASADGTVLPNDATYGAGVNVKKQLQGMSSAATATWTDATSINTALDIDVTGYSSVLLIVKRTGSTMTAGQLRFQLANDGGTIFGDVSGVHLHQESNGSYNGGVESNRASTDYYQLLRTAMGTAVWQFNVAGATTFRVYLQTAIVGTGSPSLDVRMIASTAPVTVTPEVVPVTLEPASSLSLGASSANIGDIDLLSVASGTKIEVIGDVAHDAAGSGVNPVGIGGYANIAAPSAVSTDVDMVRAWFLPTGEQAVRITGTAGALIPGDATDGLLVNLGANNDITIATLPALVAGTANIGDVDVLTVPADPFGANADAASASGSISAKLRQIATNGTKVTDGSLTAGIVDETGASAVDALAVGGGTPHDAADSGNPVKMGWKAANALPTAVANADRANGISDLFGRQLVSHIDPAMQVHKGVNYTSAQTGATIWDPTSGKRIAITSIVIGSYATTAARLILWFGANGDTTYSAGTDQLVLAASYAPSASTKPGTVFTPAVPIFCTTADHELHVTTDAGMSVDIAVEGYEW